MTDITESYDAHPSFQKGLDSIDLSEASFPYDMNSNAAGEVHLVTFTIFTYHIMVFHTKQL